MENQYRKALFKAASNNNQEKLKRIKVTCPENLIMGAFINAMSDCALENKLAEIIRLREACPKDLKTEILAQVIAICTYIEKQEAIKALMRDYSKDLKIDVLALAIAICAQQKNEEAINILKDHCEDPCSENLESQIFAKAIIILAKFDDPDALNFLEGACTESKRKMILTLATVDAYKNGPEQAYKNITAIQKNRKKDQYSNALFKGALNNNQVPVPSAWLVCNRDGTPPKHHTHSHNATPAHNLHRSANHAKSLK